MNWTAIGASGVTAPRFGELYRSLEPEAAFQRVGQVLEVDPP